jgi:hypothetical protein
VGGDRRVAVKRNRAEDINNVSLWSGQFVTIVIPPAPAGSVGRPEYFC